MITTNRPTALWVAVRRSLPRSDAATGTAPLRPAVGSDGSSPDDPEDGDGSVILRTVESEDGQSFSLYLSDERDLTVFLNVERDAADLTAPQ